MKKIVFVILLIALIKSVIFAGNNIVPASDNDGFGVGVNGAKWTSMSAYTVNASTVNATYLYGNGSGITNVNAIDTAVRVSTGIIQSQLNSVQASTVTAGVQVPSITQYNATASSTGTIYSALQSTSSSLSAEITNRVDGQNALGVSTGTLQTQISNLGVSTGTMQIQINAIQVSTGLAATLAGDNIFTGNNLFQSTITISQNGAVATVGLPNCTLQIISSTNAYSQVNIQNLSSGTAASADLIITGDQGNDTSGYLDIGRNSSQYNQLAYSVMGSSAGYMYNSQGNLVIGVSNAADKIVFFQGGTTSDKQVAYIDQNGMTVSTLTVTKLNGVSSGGVSSIAGTNSVTVSSTPTGAYTLNVPASLPLLFTGLETFGHSWVENGFMGTGGYSGLQINSNDFFSRIFANCCGLSGDRYILHAVSGSQLTQIGRSSGGFPKALSEISRTRQGFPFMRSGNPYLICWGINDIGHCVPAQLPRLYQAEFDCWTTIISKMRSSAIYPAQGGANLSYGSSFVNAESAAADWTSGYAMKSTVQGSSVTFTIPVGYQGEPICFSLVGLNQSTCTLTVGGTAGLTGTITISTRAYDGYSAVPYRVKNLSPFNAGQTITLTATQLNAGSTFYFDGCWIEAFKAVPVLVCNVPKLPQKHITWDSGAGSTASGSKIFTDKSIQYSNTNGYYDVGSTMTEVDAQGALTGNKAYIQTVQTSTSVVLNANAAGTANNIKYTIEREIHGYSSGLYWTENTDFTGATVDNHTAADTDINNWNLQLSSAVAQFDSMVQIVDLDGAIGGDVNISSKIYTYWDNDGGHLTTAGHMKATMACFQAASQLAQGTTDDFYLNGVQNQAMPSYWGAPYRRQLYSGAIQLPDSATIPSTTTVLYTAVAGDCFAFPFYSSEAAINWSQVLMDQSNAGTSVVRIGIYSDSAGNAGITGYPQTLMYQSGNYTMSGASTNTVATITNRNIYPGLTWLVVCIQSAGTASQFYTMYGGDCLQLPGWNGGHMATVANIRQPIAWKVTGVAAGSLPTIFPSGGVLAGASANGTGLLAPLIGVVITRQ